MSQSVKLLIGGAILKAIPGQNLKIGQVGTVVEIFSDNEFEVEYIDKQEQKSALLP